MRGGRNQRGSFVEAGEELLEDAGLLDLDCDVVDAAAVMVWPLASDLDERCKRPRAVGQENVLVGRDEIEERRADRQAEKGEARNQDAREDAGHRLRIRRGGAVGCPGLREEPCVRPPSTGITAPVTYDARSEARKQTTSPTSFGRPKRRSGIVARSSARERLT